MVNRRKLVQITGTVGVLTTLAGCGGSNPNAGQENQQEENPRNEDEQETEKETTSGGFAPNLRMENVSLSYGFSSGLGADIVIRNTLESGNGIIRTNIRIEAYSDGDLLGADDAWRDIQSELTSDYELEIETVSESADSSIDDVTEFVIRGKVTDGEYNSITTISGSELRERINN